MSSVHSTQDSIMRRLFITDRPSRKRFLVDTGADISVFPIALKDKRNKSKFILCIANGTPTTYGQKFL